METIFYNRPGTKTSGNISRVSYEASTKVLEVQFKSNNSVYRYKGVPQFIWDGAKSASSIGSYLHTSVIGVYPYVKVS